MNVLMVGVSPQRTGGMWTVSENYVKSAEFCKETNLIYIATSTNGGKIKRSICMLRGFIQIWRAFKKHNIDIVHVHMAEKGSVYRKGIVLYIAKKRKCKTIIHMHAGPFVEWYKEQSSNSRRLIEKIMLLADKILVLGEYWKKQMEELIPTERLEVLYNGVSIPPKNSYNEKAKNILFMGRMNYKKGIFDLLKAIKIIDSQIPKDYKFQLCGEDEVGSVLEKVQEYGIADRVQYLGWVSGKQKDDIYRNTVLNVLPTYVEGLSMTVLEAMTWGIPTITTNITTMPEMLGDKLELFAPGNTEILAGQIIELLNSEVKRVELSDYYYCRVSKLFSIESNINKLLNIYRDL